MEEELNNNYEKDDSWILIILMLLLIGFNGKSNQIININLESSDKNV